MKWLAACYPLGAMSDKKIGIRHRGSISNSIAMNVLAVSKTVPFGLDVKVDNIFLIENECAVC